MVSKLRIRRKLEVGSMTVSVRLGSGSESLVSFNLKAGQGPGSKARATRSLAGKKQECSINIGPKLNICLSSQAFSKQLKSLLGSDFNYEVSHAQIKLKVVKMQLFDP